MLPSDKKSDVNNEKPVNGEHLKALIKQLIKEQQYEGIALLFTTNASEAAKNVAVLPAIAIDLYEEVCKQYLTEETFKQEPALFFCAEELLKTMSAYAPPEELLMELLELLEENHFENVFTSALRAAQVVLLRISNKKSMALDWTLNSICTRLATLTEPPFLYKGYDLEQKRLLEQDEDIQNILMHYITLGLFYEPLITDICSYPRQESELFRSCKATNRRNIMASFLVQMLGKPLALMDLGNSDDKKTNTYTIQCASSMTKGITKCLVDPFFLLSLVEARVRWKRPVDDVKVDSCLNIFILNEEVPIDGLAIYYYMVIVGGIDSSHIPLVYNSMYVCETLLYLVQELLTNPEPALHEKALKLIEKLLSNLRQHQIPSSALDLEIHRSFCNSLCHLISYSSHTHLRQHGIQVLRQYIEAFDDEGKYLILKNLMRTVKHQGICGYLATIYKDLVANALKVATPLPQPFAGNDFSSILLQYICNLRQGVEVDLIENSDQIISSLNALRYFAITDRENRTGFWTFAKDIDAQFLSTLRKALDLSEAHYKAELRKVREGRDMLDMKQLNALNLAIGNDPNGEGLDLELDQEKKIELLNQNLCTFDLIRSLLGRVSECFDNAAKYCQSVQKT